MPFGKWGLKKEKSKIVYSGPFRPGIPTHFGKYFSLLTRPYLRPPATRGPKGSRLGDGGPEAPGTFESSR
jgi:hypothetical protein